MQVESHKRTLIVGDVHGCIDELNQLLEFAGYQQNEDRLIFVGDLINKGPGSFAVLEKVRALNAEVTMGNHELSFLKFLKKDNSEHEFFSPLKDAMQSKVNDWKDYISTFKPFIRLDGALVVHAGLVPGEKPEESDVNVLARIRTWDGVGKELNRQGKDPAWYELYDGDDLIVYGHWAEKGLNISDKYIGLDSGCVYGRQLSALSLPDRKIFQVSAKKQYMPVKK